MWAIVRDRFCKIMGFRCDGELPQKIRDASHKLSNQSTELIAISAMIEQRGNHDALAALLHGTRK